jgi:hypothetical protein
MPSISTSDLEYLMGCSAEDAAFFSQIRQLSDEDANDMIMNKIETREIDSMDEIPDDLFNEELCYSLVIYRGRFLKYIPERFKTAAFCMWAVNHCEYNIQFISDEMKEIISNEVKENGMFHTN